MQRPAQIALAGNLKKALAARQLSVPDVSQATGIPMPTLYGIRSQNDSRALTVIALAICLRYPLDVFYKGNIDFYTDPSAGASAQRTGGDELVRAVARLPLHKQKTVASLVWDMFYRDEEETSDSSAVAENPFYNDMYPTVCGHDMKKINDGIKVRIADLCRSRGISLSEMARSLNRNISAVFHALDPKNSAKTFNISLIDDVASVFNVTMEWIVFGGPREGGTQREDMNATFAEASRREDPCGRIAAVAHLIPDDRMEVLLKLVSQIS